MQIHEYDRRDYYQYEDVVATYPLLKKGCRTKNDFLKKHDIDDSRIYYARLVKNKWQVQDFAGKRDKLFIRKNYVENLVDDLPEPVPNIIHLLDNELFCDIDGNTIDIEVVGKRSYDACYFSVKDIMHGFGMKNLYDIIMDSRSIYEKDVHYKIFTNGKMNLTNSVGPRKSKIQIYLTYQGLIHMTTVSKNKNIASYRKWILKTLFTVQLGNTEDKRELAGELTGISITDIKAMCSTSSSLISCIYLFQIGTVRDMREYLDLSDDLNDDHMLYKWGKTQDLGTRAYNHGKKYGLQIRLVYKSFVDKIHLTEAEAEIRSFFDGKEYKINIRGHRELSLITKKNMKHVKNAYNVLSQKYQGRISTMNEELKDIAKDHELIICKKDAEIQLIKKDAEIALNKKDIEILQMQLKIMELSK